MTNPLVSVIMPSYNSAAFIAESVSSVLSQTYHNLELIIVDDSSVDDTLEIAESFMQDDKRVSVYKITHAGRPSVPRNFGINQSKGELIAFIDSDDRWAKNKLEFQVQKFLKKKPVLVYSSSISFGDVTVFSPLYEVLPLFFRAAVTKEELIRIGNTIPLSSVLADAQQIKNTGGFDEDPELRVEDYDLWLRLSDKGEIVYIPRIHVFYRIHGSQFSADWETKKKRIDYLSEKRGLNLPFVKEYRKKGGFLLFLRNCIHLDTYIFMRFIGFFDWLR